MEQPQISQEHQRSSAHIEALVVQTFGTQSGQLLLQHLTKQYLEAEVFSMSVQGDKQATHAAYREGENSVIRKLVTLYERATSK